MNDFVMPKQPRLVDGAPNSPAAMLLRSARTDKPSKESKDRMRAMLGLVEEPNEVNGLPLAVPTLPNRARDERAKRTRKIAKFVPFQYLIAAPKPISARKFGVVAMATMQVATILAALFVRPVPRMEPVVEEVELVRDEPEMMFLQTPPTDFQAGMTQPVRIAGADPSYPQIARDRGVKGTVILRCVLTENGLAQNCKISPSPAYLEEAVLSAAPTWRFTPVTFQGQAVPVNYVFKISFKLG